MKEESSRARRETPIIPCRDRVLCPVCAVPNAVWEEVQAQTFVRRCSRGTLLGKAPGQRGLTVLCQGRVRLWLFGLRGEGFWLFELEAGRILGLASVVTGEPWPLMAEATTPCLVRTIPQAMAMRLISEPSVASGLLRHMGEEAIAAYEGLARFLLARSARERLARCLLDLRAKGAKDDLNLSRAELAARVGGSPETLSRLVSSWVRDGVLERRGRTLRVRDWDALAAVLEEL